MTLPTTEQYSDMERRLSEAEARAEALEEVIAEAEIKLKLLLMAAGLGQKTGREALSALNDEIAKLSAALHPGGRDNE